MLCPKEREGCVPISMFVFLCLGTKVIYNPQEGVAGGAQMWTELKTDAVLSISATKTVSRPVEPPSHAGKIEFFLASWDHRSDLAFYEVCTIV